MFMLNWRFIGDNMGSGKVKLKCGQFKIGKTSKVGKPSELKELSWSVKYWNKLPRQIFKNRFHKDLWLFWDRGRISDFFSPWGSISYVC